MGGPGEPLLFEGGDCIDVTPLGESRATRLVVATLCHKVMANGRAPLDPLDPRQTCQLWHTREGGYIALFRWSGPQVIPLGRVVPFLLDHFPTIDKAMLLALLASDPALVKAMDDLARTPCD